MALLDPVVAMILWARVSMLTCSVEPRLTAWPYAAGVRASAVSAGTTSWTWQKQRICCPVPKTVRGSPRSARRAARGGGGAQRGQRRDDVVDVAEAADLLPGAEDGKGLAAQRLAGEAGDEHAGDRKR